MARSKESKGLPVHAFGQSWSRCRPATTEDVEELASVAGFALPEELAEVFQLIAGGVPEKNFTEGIDGAREMSVGSILDCVRRGRSQSAVEVLGSLRSVHEVPPNIVPFAQDVGHTNFYVLDSETGEIFYWLHDDSEQPFVLVGRDIDAFLSSLTDSPF